MVVTALQEGHKKWEGGGNVYDYINLTSRAGLDFVPGPWRVFYFYIVWSLKAFLASLLSNNWALLTLISLMDIKFDSKNAAMTRYLMKNFKKATVLYNKKIV